MSRLLRMPAVATVCAMFALTLALAADWPQYRGPGGSAVASVSGIPVTWNSTENIAWRTELPGFGTSSPIVWRDQVFVTAYSGYGQDEASPGEMKSLVRHILCLDLRSGRTVWQQSVPAEQPEEPYASMLSLHGFASSTPATDGERLYVFFGRSGVMALDLAGREQWRADVGDGIDGWGSAASVVLFENLVIVNASVESGSLVALDKASGHEVWRAGDVNRCWGTPLLVEVGGRTELVASIEGHVIGYDPRSGEKLWHCDGIQDYVCSSPVAADGVVYIIGGRQGTALAIRAGGSGDVTSTHVVWKQKAGSNVTSPVLVGEHLYWVSDAGFAFCLRTDNGEIVYLERLESSGRVYASLAAVDGKLFAVSRESGMFVLPAEPRFEVLAHNVMADDTSVFNASPAAVDGLLLLRSDRYLYAIGGAR